MVKAKRKKWAHFRKMVKVEDIKIFVSKKLSVTQASTSVIFNADNMFNLKLEAGYITFDI